MTYSIDIGGLLRPPQLFSVQGSQSYTVPAGCRRLFVECIGAGARGGGCQAGVAGGAGGTAGGYGASWYNVSPGQVTTTMEVGEYFSASGSGGPSTFIMNGKTTQGGGGGGVPAAAGGTESVEGGTSSPCAGDFVGPSKVGDRGFGVSELSYALPAEGSDSLVGPGGRAAVTANGNGGGPAGGYGGGGGGGLRISSNTNGGIGRQGVIIVWEFM